MYADTRANYKQGLLVLDEFSDKLTKAQEVKLYQKFEITLNKATKKEMKLPKSDEDIEAWATEYPDVAKIVETIAMKKAREQSAELETRIQKRNGRIELSRLELRLRCDKTRNP